MVLEQSHRRLTVSSVPLSGRVKTRCGRNVSGEKPEQPRCQGKELGVQVEANYQTVQKYFTVLINGSAILL